MRVCISSREFNWSDCNHNIDRIDYISLIDRNSLIDRIDHIELGHTNMIIYWRPQKCFRQFVGSEIWFGSAYCLCKRTELSLREYVGSTLFSIFINGRCGRVRLPKTVSTNNSRDLEVDINIVYICTVLILAIPNATNIPTFNWLKRVSIFGYFSFLNWSTSKLIYFENQ